MPLLPFAGFARCICSCTFSPELVDAFLPAHHSAFTHLPVLPFFRGASAGFGFCRTPLHGFCYYAARTCYTRLRALRFTVDCCLPGPLVRGCRHIRYTYAGPAALLGACHATYRLVACPSPTVWYTAALATRGHRLFTRRADLHGTCLRV